MDSNATPAKVGSNDGLGPVAWMRKHPDGTWADDVLPNWQIEPVRKTSGAWVPLYERTEMSPDFTDSARAALLWVLWHHQGGSSAVGQPIRFALGMGEHDQLNEYQVAEAQRWGALSGSRSVDFHSRARGA